MGKGKNKERVGCVKSNESEDGKKKRKTKKSKEEETNSSQLSQVDADSDKNLEQKSKKKAKRKSLCGEQFPHKDPHAVLVEDEPKIFNEHTNYGKKKKKRNKNQVDGISENSKDSLRKKGKKRKKAIETEDQNNAVEKGEQLEDNVNMKVKKKRTEKSKDIICHSESVEKEIPQKLIDQHDINSLILEHSDECLTATKKKKKKKKKKKETSSEDITERNDNLQQSFKSQNGGPENKQKKKKRKRRKDEDDGTVEEDSNGPESKKNKKREKKKNESERTDIGINKDNDNQSKTKSPSHLNKDVSEAVDHDNGDKWIENSPRTVQDGGSSVQNVQQGQWQGAMFKDEERQNKFLRLLGGMKTQNNDRTKLFAAGSGNSAKKKGLYGSLSIGASKSKATLCEAGGNKAFNVSEAATVDQRLEEDYNRAMSFKLGGKKSAGLGFMPDPAEGKKFHIDASASKSVKFEDSD